MRTHTPQISSSASRRRPLRNHRRPPFAPEPPPRAARPQSHAQALHWEAQILRAASLAEQTGALALRLRRTYHGDPRGTDAAPIHTTALGLYAGLERLRRAELRHKSANLRLARTIARALAHRNRPYASF